ncbi:hypothetical protein HO173_007188 [Letharia columbiana]|uniref:4'-phosphopantetheinyl transferase domain-containing protein n=1 Tax=Letharia columbiana TaxID=112416 RepID=A0A8H6FTM4_9LECA|nr:uncharacterized protein HO173_007188 [Letharia columbiana]KAF6234562.1 hypothetical protein HO173_007188 [Letharia columbiana]
MAPKPFPFPISIGIDVCRVNRIAAILRHEQTRNRWARKIFTRLEWPALCRRLQRVEKAIGEPVGQADAAIDPKLDNENQAIDSNYDNAIWMLPRLSGYSSTFEDEHSYWSAIADERSALGGLARHLAGRWAAKEAAIKAHRHRQLYMQNISIVRPILPPGSFSGASTSTVTDGAQKLIALIDPPSDNIEMIRRVATLRGLRGFGLQNHGLHKGSLMSKVELHKDVQDSKDGKVHRGVHYYRRSRVKESDRQVAEINISHDGDYAVAMCMAFDPPGTTIREKTIVDQGEGLPLHEPQWGDEGWVDLVKPGLEGGSFGLKKEPASDMPLGNLLDELESPPDPDAFKKTFKEVFENTNVPPLL